MLNRVPIHVRLRRWAPPAATAALIAGAALFGGIDAGPISADALPLVRERFRALPYAIAGYVGREETVHPAVLEVLGAAEVSQRQYTDPDTGRGFGVALVYCRDVRDLVGHYPPVCFPASGWTATAEVESRTIVKGPVTFGRHRFFRRTETGQDRIEVRNFFILPGPAENFVPDMGSVERRARSPQVAGLGAGHVMLVFSDRMDVKERDRVTVEVLAALEPVLETIREIGDE